MSIFNSLQSLLAQTPEVPAPEEIAQTWQQKLSALSSPSFQQFMEQAISAILHGAVKIAIALAVFFIGKWIINRIYHFISKAFIRRNVELSLRTFLLSLIRIILMLILIVIVIGILGINTSSFLAIFASAGLSCKKKIIITTPIAPAIKEPTKPACHPSQPTTDPTNIKDKNSPKL